MLLDWLRKNQETVAPISLLVISFALLSHGSYSKRSQLNSPFSRSIISVVGIGQGAVSSTVNGGGDFLDRYLFLIGVEKENERLRREVLDLRRQKYELEETAIENDRLKKLLRFRPKEHVLDWIPAQVNGENLSGLTKSIFIERGSADGVRPRLPVITYDGAIVGQILDEPGSRIGYHSSQVLLIIDRRSRVPVMVQRTRVKGVLAGLPEDEMCELLYTEQLADVKVGDKIITSGFGQVFMKGWPVGEVVEIQRDSAMFYPRIRIEPMADFSRMEEVMVVLTEKVAP